MIKRPLLVVLLATGLIMTGLPIGMMEVNQVSAATVKATAQPAQLYPTFLDGKRWERGHNVAEDLVSVVKDGKIYVNNSAAESALYTKGYKLETPFNPKTMQYDMSKPLVLKKGNKIVGKISYYKVNPKESYMGYISADSLKQYGVSVILHNNNRVLVTTKNTVQQTKKESDLILLREDVKQGFLPGINISLGESETNVTRKLGKGKDLGGEGGDYWISYPNFTIGFSADEYDGTVMDIAVASKQIKNKNWLKTPVEIEKVLGKPNKVLFFDDSKDYMYIYSAGKNTLIFMAKDNKHVIDGIQMYSLPIETWNY